MITYIVGDATDPQGQGKKMIVHVCNDIGAWGLGFVVPLGTKFPKAKDEYKKLKADSGKRIPLGTVQFVDVAAEIVVANMVAQRGIVGQAPGTRPLSYDALLECLEKAGEHAQKNDLSIHAPRFGAGLAGGDWDVIALFIEKTLIGKFGRAVTIYDLK
jgi:O-acetyl-ADP-ribose deacetylase (regulator of RNase III)